MLEVDEEGLDKMDRYIITTIIEKFDGGPIGINNLSAAVSEEKDILEDVYKPFLIKEGYIKGYIKRTSQGRVATRHAYRHLGFEVKEGRGANSEKIVLAAGSFAASRGNGQGQVI